MNKNSTLLLKLVIYAIGAGVAAICIFLLPSGIANERAGMYRPLFMAMYLPATPFFIGMFKTLKLLSYVDANKAFSEASVNALNYIKYCALIVGTLYAVGMPYIFMVADQDDAPGVVLIGLIFTITPLVISVLAAVFQKLLKKAIDIKLENDQIV
jgi:hypothetical protein